MADVKDDGGEVVRSQRFDRYAASELKRPQRLDNGWLKVEGRISRVGIQQYLNPDGSIRRELRLPAEVFDQRSVDSFKMVPLTNTHPSDLLDANNARAHTVGTVGENLRAEGDWLISPLMVHDADALAAIEAGRVELSCGYSCQLEMKPGVWQGQQYDAIQREIRGNHVALVDSARAGSAARIRLDANCAIMLASSSDQGDRVMAQLKIGTVTLNLTEENAPAIQQAVDALVAKVDGSEKQNAEIAAELTTTKAQLDAAKSKMVDCPECDGEGTVPGDDDGDDDKDCSYCDGTGKVPADEKSDAAPGKTRKDAIERRVQRCVRAAARRTALEIEARKHLGDMKFDGVDDLGVKKLVAAKLAGVDASKFDGKSAAYVAARFDAEIERAAVTAAGAPSAVDAARAGAAAPAAERADASDPFKARARMLEHLAGASKSKK